MKKNLIKKINIIQVLMIIYCMLLVWIILFKLSISINELSRFRNINFIPFYYDKEVKFHFREVIENILIFIPLGIYLKMLRVSNKKSVLFCLGLSLVLEICQYIFKIGASDITDIITNTSGAIIGVIFYNILIKLFKNTDKINRVLKIMALLMTIIFLSFIILIIIINM